MSRLLCIIFAHMKQFYEKDFRLGVLGGGQLGRMLIQEAVNLNVSVSILDPDKNAPCKELASSFECGDFKDFNTVYEFGKKVDLLTIEIEHVNIEALEKLEAEGVHIYPQPKVLKIVQDKGLQKQFYIEHNIPTPPFELVQEKRDVLNYVKQFPYMMKLRKGGYDGKGVTPLRDEQDIKSAFDAPSVLEKFVDFEKEISVIVARNANNEIKTFPTVECEFNSEANLVEFLFSPANVSEEIEQKAQEIAKTIASKIEIVGILAVEFFLTKDGEVLVNEIAPRPHNSGHQSIEGNYVSQYGQHLRAILNLPLGDTSITCPSVMVNLLGEKEHSGDAIYEGLNQTLTLPGVSIHLYGKKTTKPFRKMGHATVVNHDMNKAKRIAKTVKDTLKIIS